MDCFKAHVNMPSFALYVFSSLTGLEDESDDGRESFCKEEPHGSRQHVAFKTAVYSYKAHYIYRYP